MTRPLHPTDRWARDLCEPAGPQDSTGPGLEDAARVRIFGAAVMNPMNPQDLEGRNLEDRAFAGLFGAAPQLPMIGKYQLGQALGGGGMGEVFLATDTQLGRKVAIKLLRARNQDDPLEQERLEREAQSLAALSDENVVGVFEYGVDHGQAFLVMEYVEGCTLRAWQDTARRSWREVLHHYLAAGRGLAAIHAAGLIHRDFKPQNVLVSPQGRVKIADFGLAVTPGERTRRPAELSGQHRYYEINSIQRFMIKAPEPYFMRYARCKPKTSFISGSKNSPPPSTSHKRTPSTR